jgi:predicted transcriptional regulator
MMMMASFIKGQKLSNKDIDKLRKLLEEEA